MTGSSFNSLSCSVISDNKYKIKRERCAPFSACCSSDRHARPSACPLQLVCRISLRHSTDRHARPSACHVQSVCRFLLRCFSDRHTCPSACCMPRQIGLPISLRCSSDRHAHPSACPIRSLCRILLNRSFDWHSRHLHVLAADLRLFSFSRDFDTAFAAAVIAPALVIAMIHTRPDTN